MAEGHPAVHTAGSLEPPVVIGKEYFHFTVIVDALLNGPVAGNFALYL
jgi:hypothetical protein